MEPTSRYRQPPGPTRRPERGGQHVPPCPELPVATCRPPTSVFFTYVLSHQDQRLRGKHKKKCQGPGSIWATGALRDPRDACQGRAGSLMHPPVEALESARIPENGLDRTKQTNKETHTRENTKNKNKQKQTNK